MKKNDKTFVASKNNSKKSKRSNAKNKNTYLYEISDFIQKYSVFIAPIVVAIVYFQTLFFQLTNLDDLILISNIDFFKNLSNLKSVFLGGYLGTGYYRPIVTSSLMIDSYIGNGSNVVYHLTNLLIHAVACIGIYYIIKLIYKEKLIAFMGSIIYAVHPLFTNAVTWILGRNDLLVALFCIYAFIFFIKYYDTDKYIFLGLHLLCLFFGVLSKEIALIFPVICLLYVVMLQKKKVFIKKNYIILSGWGIVEIIWYLLRSKGTAGPESDEFGVKLFIKNLPVLPELISKFLIPINISVLPSYRAMTTLIGVAFILIIILFVVLKKEKRLNYILFGLIWMVLFMLPSMFVRHAKADVFFDFLDCRLYLPTFGLLFLLIELVPKNIFSYDKLRYFIVNLTIIIVLSVLTFAQNQKYKDPITFWETAANENPDKAMVYNVLGENYRLLDMKEQAIEPFYRSVKLNPKDELYIKNLGQMLNSLKDNARLVSYMKEVTNLNPKSPSAYLYYGMGLYNLNHKDESIQALKKVILLDPKANNALSALVDNYIKNNDIENAKTYAELLFKNGRNDGLVKINLDYARIYWQKGDLRSALDYLKKTISLDSTNSQAYNNLGICYVQMKDFDSAEKVFKKIIQLNSEDIQAYFTLYKLYFNDLKKYDLAYKYAQEFIKRGGKIDPAQLELLSKYKK